jgi:hypothetical protein
MAIVKGYWGKHMHDSNGASGNPPACERHRGIAAALRIALTGSVHRPPNASSGEAGESPRHRRRYKILFGLAAVGGFLLALPAAAMACVSSSACTGGGGIVITFGGHLVCSGGSQAGQSICGGGGPTPQAIAMQRMVIETVPLAEQQAAGQSLGQLSQDESLLYVLNWLAGLNGAGPNANIDLNGVFQEPPYVPPQNPYMTGHLGGPVSFSMYSSDGVGGPYGGADIFSIHNSGYRISDSAGAIAPGSLTPSFNSLGGGGGFNWMVDGTPLIGFNGNQHLTFGLSLDYQNIQTNYGTSALAPGLSNFGSVRNDVWTVTGSAAYSLNAFYASGSAAFDWTRSGITNNVDGGVGDSAGRGYSIGATAGYVFPLINTTGVTQSAMPTKAPPAARYGGYAVVLDTSAHLGYRSEWDDGFTDSTGFILGTEKVSYTDLGGRARLVAVVPGAGLLWMPFVGVSVDQQLGFRHTLDIPAQAAAAADTLFIDQSNTFWGVQAGVDLINRASIKAGVSGFYSASGDTNVVGGNVFLKIPFYAATGDSGITAAKK